MSIRKMLPLLILSLILCGFALAESSALPTNTAIIEEAAFQNCAALRGALVIPEGVQSIGAYAFAGCTGFKGVPRFPGSVTSIGPHAFDGCTGLSGTLYLLKDVDMDDTAFANCPKLKVRRVDYRVAIVTGSKEMTDDERNAAEGLLDQYGDTRIVLGMWPNDWFNDPEGTVEVITTLADDPTVKAVVVSQAIPGVSEAFARIKRTRGDVLCIAGEPQEDYVALCPNADLVVQTDFIARGYLILKTARDLGCETFVHVSFPRHMDIDSIARRLAVMKAAGEELGVKVVEASADDPVGAMGIDGAMQDIHDKVPKWLKQYGSKTAFFCTNDGHAVAMIDALVAAGEGCFIESDLPSPTLGYPDALSLSIDGNVGDPAKVLSTVEKALVAKGGADRFGTWAYPYGDSLVRGLADHAMNVIEGKADLLKLSDLSSALSRRTPGASWNGSVYQSPDGEAIKNLLLFYQDTYIMGDPGRYMGNAKVKVPEKYFKIKG